MSQSVAPRRLRVGAAAVVLGLGFGYKAPSGAAPRRAAAVPSTAKSGDDAPRTSTADHPFDHWHVAYGVFVCDRYLPPIVSENDPVGIHTHGDGVIHVHPFFAAAAGKNAVLGKFFTTLDMSMTAKALRLPGGKTWKDGDSCNAQPGHLRVLQFDDVSAPSNNPDAPVQVFGTPKLLSGDASKIRFHDRQVLALVFAPDATDVPVPPAVETLNDLNDVAPAQLDTAKLPKIGPKPKLVFPATAPAKLDVKDLVVGTGAPIVKGKHAWVRVVVGLMSKKQALGEGGWDAGGPVRLRLFGRGRIQPVGLEQGMTGMKVGGRRQLIIPPDLAWGAQGDGSGIGPNETLVRVVDLVAVTA